MSHRRTAEQVAVLVDARGRLLRLGQLAACFSPPMLLASVGDDDVEAAIKAASAGSTIEVAAPDWTLPRSAHTGQPMPWLHFEP